MTPSRPPEAGGVAPQPDIAVQVVYEDAFAVVLEKPPHLAVHPTLNYPGGTLANGYAAWALQQGGQTVCTVGAYAVANGQAYMACGQTAEPLRGKGIGGRLIVQMANALAAEGKHPVFLCAPERVHFYTRLGFAKLGEYVRFAAP